MDSLNHTSVQTLVRLVLYSESGFTVPIQSSARSKTISVKVLLESASHCTLMTDSLSKKLQLAPLYKEALIILTFAARKPHGINSYVANFNLVTRQVLNTQLHVMLLNK